MSVADLVEDHEGSGFFDEVLIADFFDDFLKARNVSADDFDDEIKLAGHCVDFNDVVDALKGFGYLGSGHSAGVDSHEDRDGIVSFLIINIDSEAFDDASFGKSIDTATHCGFIQPKGAG